jgi:hypothetical protein
MNTSAKMKQKAWCGWLITLVIGLAGGGFIATANPVTPVAKPPEIKTPAQTSEPVAPATPRDFFNAGTQKLLAGKLREAEAYLESALASQSDRIQPPALYNLGHVRFAQGAEELKKGPAGKPTAERARNAGHAADDASRAADEALASNELDKMITSYIQGRGARKELKAAMKAVKRAMETHGSALNKWQRSDGDFKGTVEMKRQDHDAQQNAETVERCIAKLVDSIREMESSASGMGDKDKELGEKLKQLKGKIPAADMPPGGAGDDEEEDDKPNGPKEGDKEGPTKDGQEMPISPEQASWLLDGFKLDGDKRLPMGQNDTAEPKARNRPTW